MQPSSIDVIADALGPALPELGQFSSPDGALTLLLTDIADAATLREELGEERWGELLRDHRAVLTRIVEHHGGDIARSEADGFMVAFSSAHAALHCAIELQRTLVGPALALGRPLGIRAGLHAGFVIVNAEDFMGRNVVLAARIAAAARSGEILVSAALKEYTETDGSLRFEPRGEFHFKGLLGEHEVYAVAWAEDAAAR